jgi:putative protease
MVGVVTHYYGKISVAAVELTDADLRVGETIHVLGRSTDFTQAIHSLQIEHAPVETAPRGASVGIKLIEPARERDRVFKVAAD